MVIPQSSEDVEDVKVVERVVVDQDDSSGQVEIMIVKTCPRLVTMVAIGMRWLTSPMEVRLLTETSLQIVW
jgi:hypothetical protein